MSKLLKLYNAVGNGAYGKKIAELAPYFGTINPTFLDLKPGHCSLVIPNTPAVHNHLGTLHAIALCNGAELAAGLTTDVSIPVEKRWIPVEMTVRYLAKARTDVTITCQGEDVDWTSTGDLQVPVIAVDTDGKQVATFRITMKISSD